MPRLRSKRSAPIRGTSQVEAERLRNELQLRPAAAKVDPAIGQNAGLTASAISGFSTAVDARISAAVGNTVQAAITPGSAISDPAGGSNIDPESRTAIVAILDLLRSQGLLNT